MYVYPQQTEISDATKDFEIDFILTSYWLNPKINVKPVVPIRLFNLTRMRHLVIMRLSNPSHSSKWKTKDCHYSKPTSLFTGILDKGAKFIANMQNIRFKTESVNLPFNSQQTASFCINVHTWIKTEDKERHYTLRQQFKLYKINITWTRRHLDDHNKWIIFETCCLLSVLSM